MDLNIRLSERHQVRDAKARVGRGIGSGNGKTCGRGHKGWGATLRFLASSRLRGRPDADLSSYVPKRGFTNARFRTELHRHQRRRVLSAFSDAGATVDLDACPR